ncbi:MAG: dephospho-CoA kinase [Bacillota bacterium]
MIIGLTGGIASGKTTVSNYLKKLGAEVINTDNITHNLLKKGNQGWFKVINCFGSFILTESGEIDRIKLGKIVFNNSIKLKKLENILHPLIINIVKKKINKISDSKSVIVEVPLLYEVRMEEMFDQVWVVYIDRQTQIKRAAERSNLSEKDIKNRMKFQIPLDVKKNRADLVIDNKGTEKDLKDKLYNIWKKFH